MKSYAVVINGFHTTLLLSDEDARKRGLLELKSAAPSNKSRAPRNKAKNAN